MITHVFTFIWKDKIRSLVKWKLTHARTHKLTQTRKISFTNLHGSGSENDCDIHVDVGYPQLLQAGGFLDPRGENVFLNHIHVYRRIPAHYWAATLVVIHWRVNLHWVLWRVFLVPVLQPKNAYSDSFLWTAWNSKASPLTPIHSCELDVRDDRQLKAWNPVY